MRARATRVLLSVGLGIGALSGCEGTERNVARDQSGPASAETSDTGLPGAQGGAPAATPKGLSDSNIVAVLDAANQADSAAGAVAVKKGTRADVKAFGKQMMTDHHGLRVEGQRLIKELGLAPKPPERDPVAGYIANERAALQKAPRGAGFDQTYIDHSIAVHQAVLDFANMARVTTQTPQLRAAIEKAIPVLRKHLEQAQAIQKQLTPAA
jgi:putative membrane protein